MCFPTELFADLPAVKMVYWDYYHHDHASYQRMFAKHRELNSRSSLLEVSGRGTVWRRTTAKVSPLCVTPASRQRKRVQVYATLWGDDGAETPVIAALLGLQYFSEAQFGNDLSLENLTKNFSFFTSQ